MFFVAFQKDKSMRKSDLKKIARQLIIDAISKDDQTIEVAKERFQAEYGHISGRRKAVIEWLMGLALPVPFCTFDIKKIGFCDGSKSGQYWDLLAEAFIFITRSQGGRGQ